MGVFIQALVNGLLNGGTYALVAVGVTLIYGVMKMVNFAMTEYLMLGMYMAYISYLIVNTNNYQAIPYVIVCMAIIGYITYRICISPIIGKGGMPFILVTMGLSFVMQNLVQLIFGPGSLTVPSSIKTSSLSLGSIVLPLPRIINFAFAIAFVVFIHFLLNKTLFGRAMRATAESEGISTMLGIRTRRVFILVYILAVVVSGIAGALITPLYYAMPTAGVPYKTICLMTVVIGGLGNIRGAFIGGLLLGMAEAIVATLISPELGPAGIFVLFLLVLYIKPQGIFSVRERKG